MILGLALGILSSFLLLTYVFNQISYDRYLPDSDRIFRITSDYHGMGNNFASEQLAACYYDWIQQIKDQSPRVGQIVKFDDPSIVAVNVDEKNFRPENFYMADSTFFDIFRFKFIYGNRREALQSPMSIVLSRQIARKYFGDTNPIGRSLTIRNIWSNNYSYRVTAVMEDVPVNSHFHPEFVARWPTEYERQGRGYYYILLKRGANINDLREKLRGFVDSRLLPKEASSFSLHLQPLTSIHLHSHLGRELEANGNITQVYALLIVALLIISITCINYVNLAIALKTTSLNELGVRRVLGARIGGLFMQNMLESTMYVLISLILVFLLYEPSLGVLEKFMNLKMGPGGFGNLHLLSAFVIEIIMLCVVTGAYPTLVARNISSSAILNAGAHTSSNVVSGAHGNFSRRVLLVVQFSMAILLISSVIIVCQQMKYVADADMGYETEQLVALPNLSLQTKERYDVLKRELLDQSGVLGVTSSIEVPSEQLVDNCQVYTGGGWDTNDAPSCAVLAVDGDFISVMKMKLLAGNSFKEFVPADFSARQFKSEEDIQTYFKTKDRVYIINQAAMKVIGWKSPQEAVGKRAGIRLTGTDYKYGTVVGVVKDFHFTSLHNKIEPVVMFVEPLWFNNVLIRVNNKNLENTLGSIRMVWNRINPECPFDYEFVSDVVAAKYLSDNQFETVTSLFSIVAIAIACIGLFSVSLFTAERKRKEIGIRKVVGASVFAIATMLTKDLARWIILANVFAWPLAYYGMNKWLQDFAYHINITAWPFLLAGLLTLMVAMFTVSWQAVRAATANPVESLRYE